MQRPRSLTSSSPTPMLQQLLHLRLLLLPRCTPSIPQIPRPPPLFGQQHIGQYAWAAAGCSPLEMPSGARHDCLGPMPSTPSLCRHCCRHGPAERRTSIGVQKLTLDRGADTCTWRSTGVRGGFLDWERCCGPRGSTWTPVSSSSNIRSTNSASIAPQLSTSSDLAIYRKLEGRTLKATCSSLSHREMRRFTTRLTSCRHLQVIIVQYY